jgi:hypothetical protein
MILQPRNKFLIVPLFHAIHAKEANEARKEKNGK